MLMIKLRTKNMSAGKPTTLSFFNPEDDKEREEKERLYKKYIDLISTLPKSSLPQVFIRYNGFWFPEKLLPYVLAAQDHFHAQPSDLLLASYPKSGTTWLKALVFSIVRRTKYSPLTNQQEHPLFSKNPHELIGYLESKVPEDPDPIASPRIFHTHSPFSVLPESVKENAKIVYVCREPKDTIVSMFHFAQTVDQEAAISDIDEMCTTFSSGKSPWGPIWDHMLEYWYDSKKNPDKVLFLKYEELKSDIVSSVRRLAMFVGFPFSKEEEKEGVVDGIVKLCSFKNLSNLDANKSGKVTSGNFSVDKSAYFRLGKIGDWKTNISEEISEKLDDIFQQKLKGSGLSF